MRKQILTDLQTYDWWTLVLRYAGEKVQVQIEAAAPEDPQPSEQVKWVGELMRESGVRALPRSVEVLGRGYDSREFWETVGVWPVRSGV